MATNPAEILALLRSSGKKLAVAESLTGGLLAAEFIGVPGASDVVLGSITAYQTDLKSALLGVSPALLESRGPIDAEVAAQMAQGVRAKLAAGCHLNPDEVVGIATTGVAGPDAQGEHKPGEVYIAVAGSRGSNEDIRVSALDLEGDREAIRRESTEAALLALLEYLAD